PLRAVVRAAERVAYASEADDTGIEQWQLGLPRAYHGAGAEVRGTVTAERGIYRPGETVHLLGILRELSGDGRLRAPRGRVQLQVLDPDGTEIRDERVRLTRFGTFREALEMPAGARLGRYQVRVRRGSASLSHRFEVGAYRADTFEVELPDAGPAERVDGDVAVPIRARYLYGAPVAGAGVRWTVSWRPRRVRAAGLEGFRFAREDQSTHLRYGTDGELRLDDAGEGEIVVPRSALPGGEGLQAADLVVEATVRDAGDDAVTGRTVQSLATRETWLGVGTDRWLVNARRGWDVRAVALSPDGRPVAGRAMELRLTRRQWRTHAARGAGGVRYDGGWEDVLVASRTVRSGTAPRELHFDLPGGGRYRVELVGEDGEVVSSANVHAFGEGGRMPVHNHPRMEVIADRDGYEPGQRARLFAQVPWARALALVTVEREGVMEARVQRLDGTSTPIEVAIEGAHAPNVFVGVTALPITDDASPASGVPLRVGYRELTVSPEQRRLQVTLSSSRDDYEPGDPAEVNVRVRDHRGRPVRAEVTLWAADEGVLQLTGYETPDPFAPAYARHDHAVATAANATRWVQPDPYLWMDGGGDGGAPAASGAALRSRFLSTAFFSRAVVTDRRGRARVRFELPDDLTRWRIMAAVADRTDRFGHAERSVTTSKPLSALPTLPRFLTQGDLADVGLVVHNHTGADGTAEVRFEVDGPGVELIGEPTRTVEVADGAQTPVRFQVAAHDTGALAVRARVRMDGAEDGFALELPIHPATAWSSEQLGEGTLDGAEALWMTVPREVRSGQAELYVTLSRSVYASMERGIESLMEYPHGCVEQTTSRLIPMVLLEELMGDLQVAGVADGAHRQRMEDAIAHVLRHQNDDGGFGLWPSSSSEGFLTAYALWGLLTARDHGYDVRDAVVDRAVSYLEAHATEGDDMHGQFSDRETEPFAAYVLAHAQREDGGLGRRLAGDREGLSRFSVGLLANALTRREAEAGTAPLFGDLESATRRRRGRALVHDPAGGGSFMRFGADLRATSSAVQALAAAGRDDEAAELVAGILAERRADGSWGTTYNNMWALYALTAYAESETSPGARVPVEVRIGGRTVQRVELAGSARVQRVVVPADALPAPGQTERLRLIAPDGARVRYSARLRYVTDAAAQRPAQHGFTVERRLFDAQTGQPVAHPEVGQLLTVQLRVRTATAQRQVAVVDRLPAGFEAVDTGLATRASGASTSPAGRWDWQEIHDERVGFFADRLAAGGHVAEYLARATRSGEYVQPAPRAEAMYDPNVWGRGPVERRLVRRPAD
ncbi:MAG TPA: MG2 domain-containing protein, partial [Sandaracinaceae bacterium LLY-WYZ-13_1]|nr:MG2 domain-containing protein [Sandaracinaceae bacterium LLY-WYZ-13_1]